MKRGRRIARRRFLSALTDDLESIEETLAILSDPDAMREIEQGRSAVANDNVIGRDQIEAMRSQLRAEAG